MPHWNRATVASAVLAVLAFAGGITLIVTAAARDTPVIQGTLGPADPRGPVWGFLRSEVTAPAAPLEAPDSAAAGSWQVVDALAAARPVISRSEVGRYQVTFPGIGVVGGRGVALATSIGAPPDGGAYCHVTDWQAVRQSADEADEADEAVAATAAGSGQVVPVRAGERLDERVALVCRDPSGAYADSRFAVLFTHAPAGRAGTGDGGPYAYLHHDGTAAAGPLDPGRYSVAGPGRIDVRRVATGRYAVDLVGAQFVRPGNNLQLNAIGGGAAGCNPLDREVLGDRQTVLVGCTDGATWADTPFALLYTDRDALMPAGAGGFAHVFTGVTTGDGPVEPAPLSDPVEAWGRYSANSTGAVNTVRRVEVGVYEVVLPGVGRGPDFLGVTAYGDATSRCSADDWARGPDETGAEPADLTATIRCVDAAGRPVDSHASVAYVSALPAGLRG
ncbi:hypothetical protein [Parafrankia sp. FMc2]|uniref:hypothetical protein n=1 Tax=Parafrankia sp. FMc2 TaxID=3233196 RepID=UPI0034D3DDA7